MLKSGHYLYIAGGVVLLADVVAGMQASSNGGTLPSWFSGTLGKVEGMVPVLPLWAWLLVGGAGLNYYHHEAIF